MKMLKRFVGVVCFLLLLVTMMTLDYGNGNAAEKPMVIKMVGTGPLQHYLTTALEKYKEILEKKLKGQIEIQNYPAQQLYSDKDLVSALPKGACEGALFNADFWAGLVPSIGPLFFPSYFKDKDSFNKFLDSGGWQIITKELEEKGNIKVLTIVDYGPVGIISKKPLNKLENFRGLRTRAYGEYIAIFLRSIDAGPIVMSSGEVYLSMQRGTIDAAMTGAGSMVDRKLYEVGKYYLDKDLAVATPFLLAFNLDFWKKLPADFQKAFSEAAEEVHNWSEKIVVETDQNYKKVLKEKGTVFTSIDEKEWDRIRKEAVPALEAGYKKNIGEEKFQNIINILKKSSY